MYTPRTTKLELRQLVDRLNAENAALRSRVSQLEGDIERLSAAPAPAAPHWDRGPRPATPAPTPRDTSFAARMEVMRKVGAHLATRLGRPATRDEVLAEVARLAA